MAASFSIQRFAAVVLVGALVVGATAASRADQTSTSSAQSARVVNVTAERFAFFPSELTVETGTEIEFHLKSEDTAHGFRILGQSVEVVIPKRGRGETTARFAPPAPGTYTFECSRMCGAGHSFMRGTIKVRATSDRR